MNILDVAQNSVVAKAKLVEISVVESTALHTLKVVIKDNGCGMSQEQVKSVSDPFYTTRTTRKVGLGIPLFKMACEMTGGSFEIVSTKAVGTEVSALFYTNHIDCMPLGDIQYTIYSLITLNTGIDFVYTRIVDDKEFVLDTRKMREILEDVPFNSPEIANFIMEYLKENSPQ